MSSTTSSYISTSSTTESSASNSPYNLHSSDNPGALITPVLLRGDNYSKWAVELWNSLQAKQKIGFLDGSVLKPTTNPDLARWTSTNSMIVGWIRTSIDPQIRSTVTHVADASKLWESLKQRFSVKNAVRKHLLQDEITNCKQNGQSVLEYYGRLSKLWEEIQNFKPVVSCTCTASAELEKEREDAKIHKFLFGLDEVRFNTIRSQIIDEDPLPELNTVYSRVIRAEQHINNMRTADTKQDAVGFSIKSDITASAVATRSRDPARSCTHCKRTGHEASEWFLLHGYPEWFLEQQQRNSSRNFSGNRGRGGRSSSSSGHGRGRLNAASTSVSAPSSTSTTVQISALITLLQSQQSQLSTDHLSGKTDLSDVIIETGASHHMTGDLSLLQDAVDIIPSVVTFPDGTASRATKIGRISLTKDYILVNVLYVPNFNCTLISVSRLLKQTGCIAIFTDTLCVLQDRFTRTLIGAGEERDGVYYFKGVKVACSHQTSAKTISPTVLWHRRLGHPSYKVLSTLPVFSDLKVDFKDSHSCDICFRAKQTRSVFHDSFNKALEPFSLIHCDVWGPYRTLSSCGAAYFLTIVDDYSRAVWTYLMLEKSQVKDLIKNFCVMSEKQFGKQVKTIRTDNGSEFMVLSSYFRQNGIQHQTSCVDTPQQNARVERKHRHILNIARSLLFQAKLPVTFWGESILTAAHLINRTPSVVLHGSTPYELLHGSKPSYDSLRTFGCLCYAHRRPRNRDKFSDRSRKCLFVGYTYGKKAWKLYDIDSNEFLASRDVVFLEEQFPGVTDTTYVTPPIYQPDATIVDWLLPTTPACSGDTTLPVVSTTTPVASDPAPVVPSPLLPITQTTDVALPPVAHDTTNASDSPSPGSSSTQPSSLVEQSTPATTISDTPPSPGLLELLGRGHRSHKPSVLLKDYVVNASTVSTPPITSLSSTPTQGPPVSVSGITPYPIDSYLSQARFSVAHTAFLAALTSTNDPKSFKEASLDDIWNDSMTDEYTTLDAIHTWDITSLPKGKKAIACQWIYKTKFDANGKETRKKSRLVACGNHQRKGRDYTDTFAPVAKPTTVRLLLEIAATKRWEIHQMDVHNVFLHGDLKEEVYMKLPPGFEDPDPTKVCRLRKSIYGLKQSPRCWFEKLSTALKSYGFKQSRADYSHFFLISIEGEILMLNRGLALSRTSISLGHIVSLRIT